MSLNDQPEDESLDLPARLFENFYFKIAWIAFLIFMLMFVAWPVRDAALVCWVYGSHAFFQHGIRVLKGKPIRFSNGELVPTLPDFVTGFAASFGTIIGLTLLLMFVLRFYERHFLSKSRPPADNTFRNHPDI